MRPRQLAVSFCILGLILGTNWTGVVAQSATPLTLANNAWPMFRHDLLHTGRSQYLGAQTFHVKWKCTTAGPVISSPAMDSFVDSSGLKATIYVGSGDARHYAISLSGGLKWSFKPAGGILSLPAIGQGGIVDTEGGDGYLYAINRGGNLVWKFLFAPECLGGSCAGLNSSPAIAVGGVIYIGEGAGGDSEGFYAIKRNGTLLWHSPGPEIRSSPSIGSDVTIYVGVDDPVVAFNPDGTAKWVGEISALSPTYIFYSSPSIAPDGTIYIGTESEGVLLAVD